MILKLLLDLLQWAPYWCCAIYRSSYRSSGKSIYVMCTLNFLLVCRVLQVLWWGEVWMLYLFLNMIFCFLYCFECCLISLTIIMELLFISNEYIIWLARILIFCWGSQSWYPTYRIGRVRVTPKYCNCKEDPTLSAKL